MRADGVPILRIGSHVVTAQDVQMRAAYTRRRYPGARDLQVAAAAQLIEGFLWAETLERLGHGISERMLRDEVARIDRSTKDQVELEAVKRIFGGGGEPFERLCVLPQLANRRLFLELRWEEDAHALFWRQAAGIPIEILDPDLRKRFEEQVTWASKLRWDG